MIMLSKLTALKVARQKQPDLCGDGGGLYLQVTDRGSKSWIFRYWIAQRDPATGEIVRDPATNKAKGGAREMGLGSCISAWALLFLKKPARRIEVIRCATPASGRRE